MMLRNCKYILQVTNPVSYIREGRNFGRKSLEFAATSTASGSGTRNFSTENPEEELLVEITNGIRKLTFNRPEKKNAVTLPMAISLISNIIEGSSDDDTKAIVVTGRGDYFTSGIDMAGFGPKKKAADSKQETENSDKSQQPPKKKKSAVHGFVTTMIECRKPLIALVNGPSVGFGVTMLGLFDAVYCSDRATFHTRFTEYGLPPEFCSTYTFPRFMGYGKANQLLLFNTKMNCSEAFECGLVSKVIPHEKFVEECNKRLEEISKLPIKSLIYSKELVRGRERELLRQVNKNEQSNFDPELAREVKRKFVEEKEKMLQK